MSHPDASSALSDESHDSLDDDETIPFDYDINAYGADFMVDNLVSRLNRGDIIIPSFHPPSAKTNSEVVPFQRAAVWTKQQRDKFVESLLFGFPVPSIFLVEEPDGTYLVLDGQQRLRTVQEYCKADGTGPALDKVHSRYEGKTYIALAAADRRRLDNALIHAIVVKEDIPTEGMAGIYQLFERLNTGGTELNTQEIRVALYHGGFVNLLRDLNRHKNWRAMYGAVNKRLRDQELILRCLAMYESGMNYYSPMRGFLNEYIDANRNLVDSRKTILFDFFGTTIDRIWTGIGKDAFRPYGRTNAAVVESIFVGVAHSRADHLAKGILRDRYVALIGDENYRKAVSTSTAHAEQVSTRLSLARQAFAESK